MEAFRAISFAQEVIFGAGSIGRLSETVESLGYRRLLVCTSPSVRASGAYALAVTALGQRLAACYDHVQPHVQDVQLNEALEMAVDMHVDGVIGMGGGSPIGMAKAIAWELNQKRTDLAPVAVIAIPTTYAGSEMTPVFGVTHTDQTPAQKITISDGKITPSLVFYDPELTLNLPAEMTASSGINALAHCIEALYSKTRNPLSTAAAISGVKHISDALLLCHADGGNLEARTEMLLGSYLAGFSLASVSMGLHHGLCHVLGGSAHIAHGIANSILLPYVIRFNADVTASQLLPAAEAMGIPVNGIRPIVVTEALGQQIFQLIGLMDLPQRLSDVGIKKSDLPNLAQLGFQNSSVQNNPKPIRNAAQIEQLLMEAL